ncbi:MAG TPA: hypothetical protein VHQ47_03290 [Phycisphaerae bacterium]|nr:hypothetical protein [Phycisphaerae bacterium]
MAAQGVELYGWGFVMVEPPAMDYASPAKTLRRPFVVMAAVSFAMAFLFAMTFVVVMTLTLPASDGAYGQRPFEDPLVFPVMAMGAAFAGLIGSVPFYFACRSRPLGRSVAIVVGVTMVELLVVTPLNGGIGFLGSFVAFAVGLVVARCG